jgi:hypothetical protein
VGTVLLGFASLWNILGAARVESNVIDNAERKVTTFCSILQRDWDAGRLGRHMAGRDGKIVLRSSLYIPHRIAHLHGCR